MKPVQLFWFAYYTKPDAAPASKPPTIIIVVLAKQQFQATSQPLDLVWNDFMIPCYSLPDSMAVCSPVCQFWYTIREEG